MDMTEQSKKHTVNDPDEISLKDLILKAQEWWRFILSKWVIILCAGILGGLIGFAYAKFKKPIYKAELSFALQDEKSGGGLSGAMGLASQFGIDLGGSVGGEFSGDNLLELMKSRSMVTRALLTTVVIKNKRQTLAEYYINFNDLRSAWKDKPGLENIQFLPGCDTTKFSLQQDSILGVLHKTLVGSNVIVDKLDKKLSIISLSVKSTDELFSKYFTEVLAKVVSDFYIQTKTEKEVNNIAILQHQTDSVKRILYGGITAVAESADVNPNPNPTLQVLRVPVQRKQIDVQSNTASYVELKRNLEVAKMALLQETPLIQVIDRPILPLNKERLGGLKGFMVGGSALGILAIVIIIITKIYKNILTNE